MHDRGVVAGRQRLARRPSQQGIDEADEGRLAQQPRGFGGRRDRRVRGHGERVDLGKPRQQQGFDEVLARRQRLFHPDLQRVPIAAQVAQRMEADRFDERAIAHVGDVDEDFPEHRLERAPIVQHCVDRAGRGRARVGAFRDRRGHERCIDERALR